jgi:hypothetical protein
VASRCNNYGRPDGVEIERDRTAFVAAEKKARPGGVDASQGMMGLLDVVQWT